MSEAPASGIFCSLFWSVIYTCYLDVWVIVLQYSVVFLAAVNYTLTHRSTLPLFDLLALYTLLFCYPSVSCGIGNVAFRLHDTFGFPYDLTRIMAEERQLTVDHDGFVAAKKAAEVGINMFVSDTRRPTSVCLRLLHRQEGTMKPF